MFANLHASASGKWEKFSPSANPNMVFDSE